MRIEPNELLLIALTKDIVAIELEKDRVDYIQSTLLHKCKLSTVTATYVTQG